jgi:hypothetical protein
MLKTSKVYSHDDIVVAFRKEALEAHPDSGGSHEQFIWLVNARDELLARIKQLPKWRHAA